MAFACSPRKRFGAAMSAVCGLFPRGRTAFPPSPLKAIRFSLLLSALLSTAAWAEPDRIVLVTEHWPPFRITDAASPAGFRGIDIEMVRKLSAALGIPIEVHHHPWARALEQMRNGQADLITGIAHTPEREAFMHYVKPSYCSVRPVFYTQKGKGDSIRSYEDLYGPSVGYSLKSAYFEPFNSDSRIRKKGLTNEVQMLHVLALGRVDLIIGTDPNMSYEVARLGYREAVEPTAYRPAVQTELYIAISRKSPAMALSRRIQEALGRLAAEGSIENILRKYR